MYSTSTGSSVIVFRDKPPKKKKQDKEISLTEGNVIMPFRNVIYILTPGLLMNGNKELHLKKTFYKVLLILYNIL